MIKPVFDNVVIKQIEKKTQTDSGIILPDSAKEKPEMGEVVATASKFFKVGQKVIYKKWGGDEVTIDNQDYLIVKDTDILGTYE